MTNNALPIVFQYFFTAGAAVGTGLLIPFIVGAWIKNKIEEDGGVFKWQKRRK